MKTLILAAAVAVVLFQATLQMAWGEQQAPIQQIHGKLSLAGETLSIITHVAKMKRSLSRPTRQAILGSCTQSDIVRALSDYPSDCINRLNDINLDRIAAGDFAEYAIFAAEFCNVRCGQPLVDLYNDCDFSEAADALVYTCSINENGVTCGLILQATTNAATPAENACLPRSATCSSSCQTALQALRDAVGCCANFTEVGAELGFNVEIDDFALWDSCGVSVTGLCTERILNGNGEIPTTEAPTTSGGDGVTTEAPTTSGGDGVTTEAPTTSGGDGVTTEAPTTSGGDDESVGGDENSAATLAVTKVTLAGFAILIMLL